MAEPVYVALFDEGTKVWRAVPARKRADSRYVLLRPQDYDPDDENWQFPPGATVICEPQNTAEGVILAAVRLSDQGPKSA
jgi:hypothetical protein